MKYLCLSTFYSTADPLLCTLIPLLSSTDFAPRLSRLHITITASQSECESGTADHICPYIANRLPYLKHLFVDTRDCATGQGQICSSMFQSTSASLVSLDLLLSTSAICELDTIGLTQSILSLMRENAKCKVTYRCGFTSDNNYELIRKESHLYSI